MIYVKRIFSILSFFLCSGLIVFSSFSNDSCLLKESQYSTPQYISDSGKTCKKVCLTDEFKIYDDKEVENISSYDILGDFLPYKEELSYSVPTKEDVEMLKYVVQQEVGNLSLKHKHIITNVIINRVNSELFPDTIAEVLSQRGQFTGYQNYITHKYKISESTSQAVESVLGGDCEDFSMGAKYFYAPKYTNPKVASWFENNLEFLFEFEGHRFFKEKS